MKPKYKPGSWVLVDGSVELIKAVNIVIEDKSSEDESGISYVFYGSDDYFSEQDIICQMVKAK